MLCFEAIVVFYKNRSQLESFGSITKYYTYFDVLSICIFVKSILTLQVLYDSIVSYDFLDELVSENPLHPKDPYEKAQQRLRVEKYGSKVRGC